MDENDQWYIRYIMLYYIIIKVALLKRERQRY